MIVMNISAAEARAILDSGDDVLFLDVREPGEFSGGHITGALNMPWNSGVLQAQHGTLPNKPIVVYCGSGGRSAAASAFLVANGHVNIYNMLGGYSAWTALPTRTPTSTPTSTPTPTITPVPIVPERADINEDGYVNEKDLMLLQLNWRHGQQ